VGSAFPVERPKMHLLPTPDEGVRVLRESGALSMAGSRFIPSSVWCDGMVSWDASATGTLRVSAV
jgi:hypothetical protein